MWQSDQSYWVVEHVGAEMDKRWMNRPPNYLNEYSESFAEWVSAFKFTSYDHAARSAKDADAYCRVLYFDSKENELRSAEPEEGLPPPYHSGPGMFGNAWPLSKR